MKLFNELEPQELVVGMCFYSNANNRPFKIIEINENKVWGDVYDNDGFKLYTNQYLGTAHDVPENIVKGIFEHYHTLD